LAVTLIFGAAALADDEEKHEMKIVIAGGSSGNNTGFHMITNDAGFDMQSMQVGESQSIVDESGKSVLITREEDGFRFDIDGETIVLPDMGDMGLHGAHMAFVDGSDFTGDFDVEVMGDHQFMSAHASEGVTIITGEALDQSTKDSIRAVLQSAGRSDEVTFIDASGADGQHVKMIRKQVEVIHH
jgi:hypothetical protein